MTAAAAAWAVAALLLAGCATRPPVAADALSGRIAVRIEALGDQPLRHVNAAFDLRGDADRGELQLSTQLGTTLASARWSDGAAWLVTAEGERRFDDLHDLARQALGEALPLRALPDWLRGRPWAGAPSKAAPAPARGFEQLGWTVDLQRLDDGWLEARRDSAPQVTVRARLERAP